MSPVCSTELNFSHLIETASAAWLLTPALCCAINFVVTMPTRSFKEQPVNPPGMRNTVVKSRCVRCCLNPLSSLTSQFIEEISGAWRQIWKLVSKLRIVAASSVACSPTALGEEENSSANKIKSKRRCLLVNYVEERR